MNSEIEGVVIPADTEEIGDEAFRGCAKLKYVTFERNQTSEKAVSDSAKPGKAMLPRTLKKIGHGVFSGCEGIKEICAEEGCEASLSLAGMPDSVGVHLPLETMVGGAKLRDLRSCKQVVIPEGVERIWNQWFWGSDIESVEVPASVKEIGADAFYDCRKLKSVTFAPKGGLERIVAGCFHRAGIETIAIPKGV